MQTVLAILACLFLSFFPQVTSGNADRQKVTLQLRWDHQFQFAGYYCALWQGYYRDANLEVEIRPAVTDAAMLSSVEEVGAGRADFGIGAADILLAHDKKMPLVVLASIFQHSAAAFYALPGTRFDSPGDFARLRVARNVNDLIDISLQVLLRAEGVDPATVTPLPHQPSLQPLLDRSVDVIPGYTISRPIAARLHGIRLRELSPRTYGIDFYGDSLFTLERTVSENPEMVERFLAASLKGWQYALDHRAQVADRISTELVRGSFQEDIQQFNRLQSQGVAELINYPEMRIGNTNPDRWLKMHEQLTAVGILTNPLDIEKFIFDPDKRQIQQQNTIRIVLQSTLVAILLVTVLALVWAISLKKAVRRQTSLLNAAQNELLQQNDHLTFLYNQAPAMLHSIDLKGRFLFVSDYWLEAMGYEREEVIGSQSVDYLTEESRNFALSQALPHFFATGRASNVQYQFVRKNGEVFDALLNAVLIKEGGTRQPYSLAAIIDVTHLRQAEQALQQSEERFQLAMDFVQDGIYDWNLVTNEIYYSPRWKKMLGYEDHELPNDFSVWEKLTDPEHVQQSWLMLNELLEKKREQFALEFRMLHKAGHWVDILSRAKVVFDQDGKGVRVVGTHVDISASKRAEEALLKEKQRTEQYLQLAGVIFIGLNTEGRIFLANRKACETLGCSREHLQGADWFERFIPEEHRQKTRILFQEFLDSAVSGEIYFENHIVAAGGIQKLIAWRTIRLTGADGSIIGTLSSGEDITELHATLTELSRQRNLLNLIIDSMPVLITLYDSKVRMLKVNEEFARVVGWSTEDLFHIDLMTSCYPDPEYREVVRRYMAEASNDWREFTITTRDGDLIETIWSNIRLEDGTQVGIGIDITEKKNTEEMLRQARKMEAIGTLAGGIAHDFNNILAAILGFSRLIKERCEPGSENEEDIDEVINAGTRAADLVAQILAYSRKQEIQRLPVELDQAVQEALKLLRATIPTTVNIDFTSTGAGRKVLADRTQLNQVLMNLCTNAAHALETSGDTITITITPAIITDEDLRQLPRLHTGKYLVLTVADNGCGIPADHLDRIFDPYFTTKAVGKGSGMGLAVVMGIVVSHHGEIQIASEIAKGTTVTVYLPEDESAAVQLQQQIDRQPDGNEHILVVDDEPQLVSLVTRNLTRLGYTVTSCSGSIEALQVYRQNPEAFQLVLTDQTMPQLSGTGLTQAIQEINPQARVIIYSGYRPHQNDFAQQSEGVAAFLAKPFTTTELAEKVREVLDTPSQRKLG